MAPAAFASRSLNGQVLTSPATAGSVLRASTGAEIAHIFTRLEHHGWRGICRLGHLAADVVEVGLYPCHAGNFDFAILRDPKYAGNIG